METKRILNILVALKKYPLEVIFAKQLFLNGIDTEEKLIEILKENQEIPQPVKLSLQTALRDIERKFYDINKIPTFFK
jgi:hypothetical protein